MASRVSEPHSVGMIVDRRYRLKREIARGAAGVVYEAEHAYTRRSVAVKLLTAANMRAEVTRRRLLLEAIASGLSRHPGVAQVLDAGEADDVGPYLVMELLEGRTLQGILGVRQRISPFQVIQIGRQICEALAVAHRHGVIHRDIKPSNLFVVRDEIGREVIKVIDFGVARVLSSNERRLTEHEGPVGTPEYMAPEQMMGLTDAEPRQDIYAVGVVLFECLTGSVPFEGNFGQVLAKSALEPMPTILARNPAVPLDAAAVVEKALAREPDGRHESMEAFADALALVNLKDPGGSLLGLRPPRPIAGLTTAIKPKVPVARPVDQRRRFARAPFITPVRILRENNKAVEGRCEDISAGGLLVETSTPMTADEVVKVRFALPVSGRIIELGARSKWIKTVRGTDAVGLEFIDLPPDALETIENYVSEMGGT